jgi:hypothetical protein
MTSKNQGSRKKVPDTPAEKLFGLFLSAVIVSLMACATYQYYADLPAPTEKVVAVARAVSNTSWKHCDMHDKGVDIRDLLSSGKMMTVRKVRSLYDDVEQCNSISAETNRVQAESARQAKIAAEQLNAISTGNATISDGAARQ